MEGRLSTNADSASVFHHLSFHPGFRSLDARGKKFTERPGKNRLFLATESQQLFTNPAKSA
jgi:hypothetical protein